VAAVAASAMASAWESRAHPIPHSRKNARLTPMCLLHNLSTAKGRTWPHTRRSLPLRRKHRTRVANPGLPPSAPATEKSGKAYVLILHCGLDLGLTLPLHLCTKNPMSFNLFALFSFSFLVLYFSFFRSFCSIPLASLPLYFFHAQRTIPVCMKPQKNIYSYFFMNSKWNLSNAPTYSSTPGHKQVKR
jgi:hypothetical protein